MYIAVIGAVTILLYKHYEQQNNLNESNIDNFSNRDSSYKLINLAILLLKTKSIYESIN